MSRTAKKFIYGAVYLVILLLIILGIYGIWFKKVPSAPCTTCAFAGLSISSSTVALQAGQDQSVVLATLGDPSSAYGVAFSYNVVVDSVLGEQLDAFTGSSSISPNGTRYLVLTGISANPSDVGAIIINTNNLLWTPAAKMVQYDLPITDITTSVGESEGYVDGTISNGYPLAMQDVRLSAILYDKFGDIVGASAADVGSLDPFSKNAFQVFFPPMDVKTANSVDNTKTQVFYEVNQN